MAKLSAAVAVHRHVPDCQADAVHGPLLDFAVLSMALCGTRLLAATSGMLACITLYACYVGLTGSVW